MKKLIGKLRQATRRGIRVVLATVRNRSNAHSNHQELLRQSWLSPLGTFDGAVNRLSNWQRNQWAKAGYPGLVLPTRRDAEKVLPYTEMQKHRRKVFAP